MALPSEILSHISSFLPKSTLKQVRLAGSLLHDIATPLLFDSVFLSARPVDRKIAELVASRFPSSIKTLIFSSERFSPPGSSFSWAVREAIRHELDDYYGAAAMGRNLVDHHKEDKYLRSDQPKFYDSGAAQTQLTYLLNTLPRLDRIVITTGRRRQDLSWLEESQIKTAYYLKVAHTSKENIQTPVKQGKAVSVRCKCFDHDSADNKLQSVFVHADLESRKQNPWAEIVKALHNSSNVSIKAICIQRNGDDGYRPFSSIQGCDPETMHCASMVLPNLTKLDLHLSSIPLDITKRMYESLGPKQHLTRVLSSASNLTFLTIDFQTMMSENPLHEGLLAAFDALLGGCRFPHLTTLYLRNFSFREHEVCAFLQHSPNIHHLSLQSFWMVDDSFMWRTQEPSKEKPNKDSKGGSWQRLLQAIKDTLPNLVYFRVGIEYFPKDFAIEQSQLSIGDLGDAQAPSPFNEGIDPLKDIATSTS